MLSRARKKIYWLFSGGSKVIHRISRAEGGPEANLNLASVLGLPCVHKILKGIAGIFHVLKQGRPGTEANLN